MLNLLFGIKEHRGFIKCDDCVKAITIVTEESFTRKGLKASRMDLKIVGRDVRISGDIYSDVSIVCDDRSYLKILNRLARNNIKFMEILESNIRRA